MTVVDDRTARPMMTGPWPAGRAGSSVRARYGREEVAEVRDEVDESGEVLGFCLATLGHGTQPAERMTELLGEAGVRSVVDVRIAPGSRRHPQFARAELSRWLPERGIDYRWERRLGGFRTLPADSPDRALTNRSFRAYAAYMRTDEFESAMGRLVGEARRAPTAIMCSESVWWRCHRRLIADHAVLVDGLPVRHLMPDGRSLEHSPTSGVRVDGRQLVYDVVPEPAPRLPLSPPELVPRDR